MSFSWNKWRQYITEEASANEKIYKIKEILPFFQDAANMGIIDDIAAQRVMDAAGNSEDQDHFERTQEFQQIGREIIMSAVKALEQDGRETHYLHKDFAQSKNNPVEGADISNAVNILRKGGAMSAVGMALPEGEESLEEDKFDQPGWDLKAIMDAFKEDFDEASNSTDDIPYAQERVIAAYKDVFAKSHPQLSREIDMYLNKGDAKAREMFQNVADNPEVVGRDMMAEAAIVATFNVGDVAKLIVDRKAGVNQPGPKLRVLRVEDQMGGRYQNVLVQNLETMEKVEYDNTQLALVEMGKISREEEAEEGGMFGEVEGGLEIGEIPFGSDPKDFGNDLESRFQFIAPRLVRHPGKMEELKPFFMQMTDAMDEDDKVAFDDAFVKAMQIMGYGDMLSELEGEVQSENDRALDEAQNEMALEKAMGIAGKLSDLQYDLEATLSDDEIDTLSDAIMLLKKKRLGEATNQEDLDKNYFALAHEMGLKDLRPSPEVITDKWYKMNVEDDLKANDVELRDFQWVMKYFFKKGADRDKLEDLRKKVTAKHRENEVAKNREMFSYLYDKDGKLKPEYKNK